MEGEETWLLKPIEWSNDEDKKLLRAVDEYVAEYGTLYEQDWQLLATFGFEDPRQFQHVHSRYITLSQNMNIKTFADYRTYHVALNKAALEYSRARENVSTRFQQSTYRASLKSSFSDVDADLESDLIVIKSACAFDTLLHRRIWNYLGSYNRISFMRYLDVTDKLIDRMPDKQFGRWAGSESELIRDLRAIATSIGDPFEKSKDRRIPEMALEFGSSLNLCIQNQKDTPEPYCRQKTTDFVLIRKLMEDKVNDMFTPEEWENIFSVVDNWSPLLVKLWRGKKPATWFMDKRFQSDENLYKQMMSSLGISTVKTRQEVEIEFCSFVLPNYWMFPDALVEQDSKFPNLQCKYSFQELDNRVCCAIYNSLTLVSLKHVRKTILYLFAAGVVGSLGHHPTYYFNGFVRFLLDLPCGECWGVDPVEFETIRSRLEEEVKDVTLPELSVSSSSVHRWSKCIKGANCFWDRNASAN